MKNDNGQQLSLTQALDLLKSRQGKKFKTEDVNLAELERLTGITRARLRRLKKHDFKEVPHGSAGKKLSVTVLLDWGFVHVHDYSEIGTTQAACFAMICHHCGQRYGTKTSLFCPVERVAEDTAGGAEERRGKSPPFFYLEEFLLFYIDKKVLKVIDFLQKICKNSITF